MPMPALRPAVVVPGLLLALYTPVVAGPLQDAQAADKQGDYALELKLLLPIANEGDARAELKLGQLYLGVFGVSYQGIGLDYEMAQFWLHKAAEQGDSGAEETLGFMYDQGEGVQADQAQAMKWYRKSAEHGYAFAQYKLGVIYDLGLIGEEVDFVEAAKWYRAAAGHGVGAAEYNLGVLCKNGWGVPQDYEQAHMWFNLAAAQGSADAVGQRDAVAKLMTPEQVAQAQKLASDWIAAHPTP